MLKQIVLMVVRVGRALFYGTALHRSARANALYEKMFHIAFPSDAVVDVAYEGATFRVPARDITILPSLLNNSYEKQEFALLREVLQPGMTFVDVGANIGLFTVVAAAIVGLEGRVFAFEPEPDNVGLLRQNLAANGLTNVCVESVGVGAAEERRCLHVERGSIGTHSFLERGHPVERDVWVDVVTLDDYFAEVPGPLDVVKIDVEGYEPLVIHGARGVLDRVQFLFFENNGGDFAELLRGFPYCYGIDGRSGQVTPVSLAALDTARHRNVLATKSPVVLEPARRPRSA